MQEGIIQSSVTEEEIAEFLINTGYPNGTVPVTCILTGSRGYGIEVETSDRDYVGIHFMDTWECLEHPNFRSMPLVVRKQFDKDLEEMPPGTKGGDISLDSFEMWKFTDLMLKGAFVAYEILYMPVIHQDPGADSLIQLCRAGLTNRIGKAARGNALHDWRKHKSDRKKAIMAYYRLLQAIFFLREGEFEWQADALWEYVKPVHLADAGLDILNVYQAPETRKTLLTEKELDVMPVEIEKLVGEVEKAMVVTKLPDQCPRKILDEILQRIKRTRSTMI